MMNNIFINQLKMSEIELEEMDAKNQHQIDGKESQTKSSPYSKQMGKQSSINQVELEDTEDSS